MKRTFAFLFLLLLPIELAAAVRGDKARYVGGTISSLPEATEGRLDTKNEEKLIFNSSQGSFEVPYKNITSLEYGQKAGRRVGVANRLAQPFASRIDGQNLNLAIPSNYISGMVAHSNSEGRWLARMPLQIQAVSSSRSRPNVPRPIAEVLAAAKTICVLQTGEGNPTVKAKVSERLTKWGRLNLVSSPHDADLVLEVTQIGEYNMKDHFGTYSSAMGVLKEPGATIELWTVTKGSYWSFSGFSIAKVSTQIGDAFVKFFESTIKQPKKRK